jgi:hypothetical protein
MLREYSQMLNRLVSNHGNRIEGLEHRMNATADKILQIDNALNRQGDGLRLVADRLTALQTQVGGLDNSIAEQLTPLIDTLNAHADRLTELAADPNNPVPNPEPIPNPA